ncbi:MAG: TlpA family protein disulfide reductase [Deltaproteobacteria bacterium]|nr:TlpA family protein disulfide reductase [Deltaproteobacteria bacterium]
MKTKPPLVKMCNSLLIKLVCLLMIATIVSCSSSDKSTTPVVSDFSLPDLNGGQVRLSQLKGRIVMLNFWATWCPPCREEIPWFVSLQDEYGPQGLTIVGVSVDSEEMSSVRSFSLKYRINYPVLYAGDQIEEVVKKVGGFRGIPTTILLDRQGKVVKKLTGAYPRQTWEKELKLLL